MQGDGWGAGGSDPRGIGTGCLFDGCALDEGHAGRCQPPAPTAPDLFGEERALPIERAPVTPAAPLDDVLYLAERRALESGRPVSQERAEILFGKG